MKLCFYCGQEVHIVRSRKNVPTPNCALTRDHKVPIAKGGGTLADNRVTCCLKCNQEKGLLSLEEFRLVMAFREGKLVLCNEYKFYGEREVKVA